MRRVICRNWIVDIGHDPSLRWNEIGRPDDGCNRTIVSAVNYAMMTLDADELDFVRSYFIQGQSCRKIADNTGKTVYRVEQLHRSALKKLKERLRHTLGGTYSVPPPSIKNCPLCNHPKRRSINILIKTKKTGETWQRIIGTLHDRYGIALSTMQIMLSHKKYHMK